MVIAIINEVDENGKTIHAVVASSVLPDQWYVKVGNDLFEVIKSCVQKYQEVNGAPPICIAVLRSYKNGYVFHCFHFKNIMITYF